MSEIFCNTSPLQYLHQIAMLHLLPALAARVVVPPAVAQELAEGRAMGVDLPDWSALNWLAVRRPVGESAVPLVPHLGPGETEVLMLALESREQVALLDDALARRVAETLGLKVRGTLGVLLDAKHAGLIEAVAPLLARLQTLGFRVAQETRAAVLKLAGEGESSNASSCNLE